MRLTSALVAPALLAASIGAASAADLQPAYKAPVSVSAHNWTGFYLGAVAGYGFGDADAIVTGLFGALGAPTTHPNPRGWLAGGTIGYNYQQGNVVVGLEGEFYGSGIKGDAMLSPEDFTSFSNRWTATAAARLGVAFDRTLVYTKLGAAWANNEYKLWAIDAGSLSVKETNTGWLVGAGVEWAFAGNWSAKLEATYASFGRKNYDLFSGVIGFDVDAQVTSAKFGINYRFN